MVPATASGYGAGTVRPMRSPFSKPSTRALIVLALSATAALAGFGPFALPAQPQKPVAVAAPSASGLAGPSASGLAGQPATPPTSPPASPSPTASPPRVVATTRAPIQPALPVTAPVSGTPATRAALSLRLDSLRARYGLPGVSAAILFADGSMWRGTSGEADVEASRPVTPDTAFAVASISKTFLAALILALAEEGQIDLETPVTSYLPTLAIDPAITVRQLLDHTSGLHDYFYAPDIDAALLIDRERVWTAEDALGYVGKPYFKPGRGWHYSNTNYLVLGMLAEEIGGRPLATQFRARFLGPLGLDRTRYQSVEEPRGPVARAYRFNGPDLDLPPIPLGDGTAVVPFTSVVTAAGSAGSIASTARDLVIWARALYEGTVLSPASRFAMVADIEVTASFKPTIPYGLGVQAATIDGRRTLGHSGRLLGSRSVVRWLPDERIAIAVLTNQSRADPNIIARALLQTVLGTVLGTAPECAGCPPPN